MNLLTLYKHAKPDWYGPRLVMQYKAILKLIRKSSGAHHAFPIIVTPDDSEPVVLGEKGHFVDRQKGRTKKYVRSTRTVEVGILWIQEHGHGELGKLLFTAYHKEMAITYLAHHERSLSSS